MTIFLKRRLDRDIKQIGPLRWRCKHTGVGIVTFSFAVDDIGENKSASNPVLVI